MNELRRPVFFVSLFFAVLAAGCGPSFTPALEPGFAIPEGKVLVVGKVVLSPPFDAIGKKKIDKEPFEILMGTTFDLSQQIEEGAMYRVDEAIAPIIDSVFFFPLPPGVRYIRSGQIFKVIGHNMARPKAGQPIYEVLRVYRNIKVDAPANAKVVYIGTIVYQHDGKRTTSVTVRDEFDHAARELGKMKIPGLKSSDMVKKLAVVVK